MELEKVVQLIASLCKPEFENLSTPIKHQIVLISRHNIEREQKELDDFEKIVCRKSLEKYVHEVFYDSNACLCCFEFSKEVEKFSPLAGEFLVLQ